jgi:hypothetical protein
MRVRLCPMASARQPPYPPSVGRCTGHGAHHGVPTPAAREASALVGGQINMTPLGYLLRFAFDFDLELTRH